MQRFPAHVVASWLGHTPEVAESHYLMVRAEDYAAAVDFRLPSDRAIQIPRAVSPHSESTKKRSAENLVLQMDARKRK